MDDAEGAVLVMGSNRTFMELKSKTKAQRAKEKAF